MEQLIVDIVVSPNHLKAWKVNINKYVNGIFVSSEPSNLDTEEIERRARRTYGKYFRRFIIQTTPGERCDSITKDEDDS
jgi:hypothetical protein